jgi:serine/threonine-protein kinase ATR
MLVDISMEAATSYDATPAFQDYLAWMLDSFLGIHELQKRRRESLNLPQSYNKLEELSFCAVHALISAVKDSMSPTIVHKCNVLLSILVADILERPADLSGDSIRVSLCSCLLTLSAACKEDDPMCRLVSPHIMATVTAVLGDEGVCNILGDDFKVCARHGGQLHLADLFIESSYFVLPSLSDRTS